MAQSSFSFQPPTSQVLLLTQHKMGKRKRDDNSEGKNGESASSEALEKDVASAPKRFKPDDGPEGS